VDLREVAEQQVSGGLRHGQRTAVSASASELPRHTALWAGPAPVVLVCRSGNRSLQVAQWRAGPGPHRGAASARWPRVKALG